MSARTSRRTAVVSGIALVGITAALAAPGAAAAETVDGDVSVTSTETVSVQMGADGKAGTERVYEQLVLDGKGSVDLSNPVSTKNLRNLDGFGGWEVVDGVQRVKTDVDGEQKYRSVSDFDGDLPVDVDIQYTFEGKRVQPGDVVGKDGELQVVYTVKNATGKTQDVTFTDGEGKTQTVQQAVVIPMVGSMTVVLPSNFTDVRPDGANSAGDGKGGTQLSFTMTLFPPIGSDRATFGYTAHVVDGVIPKASMSLLPVNPLENNSFKGGAASYQGGATKGVDLTAGALTIDENLLKIRDGANELVSGILQLRDGAQQLNAGLAGKAAPGAGQLADGANQLDAGANKLDAGANKLNAGAGQLDAGARKLDAGAKKLDAGAGQLSSGTKDLDEGASKLAKGAGDLSAGLQTANAGAPALLDGVAQLKAGAEAVDAGLLKLRDTVNAGGAQFKTTFAGSVDGGMQQVIAGLTPAINGALDNLNALVQNSAATPQEKAIFNGNVQGTKSGLVGGLAGALTGPGKLADQLKAGVNGGVDRITGGVAGGVGDAATAETLRNGTARIIGGLTELGTKGGELVTGLGKLSAGADQLASGTGDLKQGTGRLRAGAGTLADGTGTLADGTGTLAGGTGTLSGGTNELAAGTGTLIAGSGKLSLGAGTLAGGLNDAAEGSGKLSAGLEKAAESAPGLPEGAQKLSDQGTSQLVNVGNGTAKDFGLKYALIEAGAARAAEAQPYGSPDGAFALTAYKFDIAGESGEASANTTRGIAIAVLAAGALGLAALRRRITPA